MHRGRRRSLRALGFFVLRVKFAVSMTGSPDVVAAEPAIATEPIPGHSLESIRSWGLEHNPELRALDFEAQAAEARILPAGVLPDPMASVGFRGLDPDKPWRTADAGREVNYRCV